MQTPASSAFVLALALGLGACSLVPDAPPPVRHFEPPITAEPVQRRTGAELPRLRLRATRGSAHLDTRLAYRLSEVETGHHEGRRWTETPARYVDLALAAAFFESGRFRRSVGSSEPVLSIELLAFEELRDGDGGARVEFRALLEGRDGHSIFERRYAAEVDAAVGPEQVARALGLLLCAEAAALAADVEAELAARGDG